MLTFTERCFEQLDPLQPIATGIPADLAPVRGIKAVLFDVYGTLLISESGDIDIDNFSVERTLACLAACDITLTEPNRTELAQAVASEFYHTVLRMHRRSRSDGVEHPEINVANVWQEVTDWARRQGVLHFAESPDCEKLALCFEIECNPVYPMPGMRELLRELAAGQRRLGLVSNAQFFTPLLLNYFISGRIAAPTSPVPPFTRDLTVFSYEHGRAKPDPVLFMTARQRLAELGIAPSETLYVGNDMLNDVWGAKQAGFRAALFAGDKRSLRLRRDREEVADLHPDAILTELPQLLHIIGRDT